MAFAMPPTSRWFSDENDLNAFCPMVASQEPQCVSIAKPLHRTLFESATMDTIGESYDGVDAPPRSLSGSDDSWDSDEIPQLELPFVREVTYDELEEGDNTCSAVGVVQPVLQSTFHDAESRCGRDDVFEQEYREGGFQIAPLSMSPMSLMSAYPAFQQEGMEFALDEMQHTHEVGFMDFRLNEMQHTKEVDFMEFRHDELQHTEQTGSMEIKRNETQHVEKDGFTVMVRNVPNKYSRDMFVKELEETGFLGTFDFLYLPIDPITRANKGYAFVNFVNNFVANIFMDKYENRRMSRFDSGKRILVSPAVLQGFEANYAHYSQKSVNQQDEKLRPLFLRSASVQTYHAMSKGTVARLPKKKLRPAGNLSLIDRAAQQQTLNPGSSTNTSFANRNTAPSNKFCGFCRAQVCQAYRFCQSCGHSLNQ